MIQQQEQSLQKQQPKGLGFSWFRVVNLVENPTQNPFINFMVTTVKIPLESYEKYKYLYSSIPRMAITTIKLTVDIKERLDAFKIHPRETYNEVIQRIMDTLRLCKSAPEQARAHLIRLDRMRDTLSGKSIKPASNPVNGRSPNPPRNHRS
jgi:hypothetical protein